MGFRFTSERVANDLELTGWVKNNHDGSVEIVCEGKEENLSEFLKRIEDFFSGYIRDKDINWSQASGEFKDFSLKF